MSSLAIASIASASVGRGGVQALLRSQAESAFVSFSEGGELACCDTDQDDRLEKTELKMDVMLFSVKVQLFEGRSSEVGV